MRAKDLRPTKRMIQAYRNAVELQWSSDLSKIVSTCVSFPQSETVSQENVLAE